MTKRWGGRRRGAGRPKGSKGKTYRDTDQFSGPIPAQEILVRERFAILNEAFGLFRVVDSRGGFPDLVLRAPSGKVIRAEVETLSRHFHTHGHDPKGCDLIICWKHNWIDCPVPVFRVAELWCNYMALKDMGAWAWCGQGNPADYRMFQQDFSEMTE